MTAASTVVVTSSWTAGRTAPAAAANACIKSDTLVQGQSPEMLPCITATDATAAAAAACGPTGAEVCFYSHPFPGKRPCRASIMMPARCRLRARVVLAHKNTD